MDKIRKNLLRVQSKRKEERTVVEAPIKALLKKRSETCEVKLIWQPNFSLGPLISIHPRESRRFESVNVSEANVIGIVEDASEKRIAVNRGEYLDGLELIFISKEAYDKALVQFQTILRDDSSDSSGATMNCK